MSVVRTLLEAASRNRILLRRMPGKFGGAPIYVTPEARLRFWSWDLYSSDPHLFDAAEELVSPGEVVWDVGANVGLFSFAAAAKAGSTGQVIAIEPDLCLVDLLRRSVRMQPPDSAKVTIVPAAVSNQMRVAELQIGARGRCSNYLASLGGSHAGGVRELQHVVAITLDWMAECFPSPSLLKVDVEGAEALVLQGAKRLLALAKPKILIEVWQHNSVEVNRLLREHGYSLFDADQLGKNQRPLERPVFNTLAVFTG